MVMQSEARAERSKCAILDAARELLRREGPRAVTHLRVARHAGVGRATVYRHWPRPHGLLLDVMSSVDLPIFDQPAAPIRAWLHTQLRRLADELARPEMSAVAFTFMGADPRQRDVILSVIADRLEAIFAEAVRLGEIAETPDTRHASALMLGPIVYRITLQSGAVCDELLDNVLDSVARWV